MDDDVLDHSGDPETDSQDLPEKSAPPEDQEREQISRARALLDSITELMPKVADGDRSMAALLLQNFEALYEIPIPTVKKALGAERPRRDDIDEDARRGLSKRHSTKAVIRGLDYTPHLPIDDETRRNAARILLHTAIADLLARLEPLIRDVLAKKFINLQGLMNICAELAGLRTDVIADTLGITDETEISRLRSTLHDMANALCAVSGFSELYSRPTAKGSHAVRISEQIAVIRSTQHILDEFFRPSAPKPHALCELVASIEKSIRRMMSDRGIADFDVVLEIDEAGFDGTYVSANRTNLLEVFKNFARNAYDAKNVDTCVFKIMVSRDPKHPGRVLFFVQNNGSPIPQDELSDLQRLCVFKVVNRAAPPEYTIGRKFGREWGTGLLGSAIALRDMGGSFVHIKPTSELGGAEFCICLPETPPLG